MPKRSVIKIIMLSLATLGTVVICTAINRAESARMMAADSPGVPGSLLAVLGILAMGPLTYGAAYVPVCLWGHPLWGEALWYLMHLGLAAAVGIFSGTDVRRYFFMPIFPFLVTYMQIGPPILPGSQPKLPWALGEAWCCICLAAGILCMLVKACFKPAR